VLGDALADRTAAGVRALSTTLKPAVKDEELLRATRSNEIVRLTGLGLAPMVT
jgi:hypothetical protein